MGDAIEALSSVETLAAALKFAQGALSTEPLAQVAGLVTDLIKSAAHNVGLQDQEDAARARVNAILQSGIENVTDHDMQKCYMARLGTSLTT